MKSLVIFASGRGSNAEAIIQHFKLSPVAQVKLIVCNKAQAGVIKVAEQHIIPVLLIDPKSIGAPELLVQLDAYKPDLIILAGFLLKIPSSIIGHYPNKIVNIHPSLLPKYGGKGMYGHYVYEAVLAAAEKVTGITIHFVNEHYDDGAYVLQAHCPIDEADTSITIAQKISRLEIAFFPKTIEYLLNQQ